MEPQPKRRRVSGEGAGGTQVHGASLSTDTKLHSIRTVTELIAYCITGKCLFNDPIHTAHNLLQDPSNDAQMTAGDGQQLQPQQEQHVHQQTADGALSTQQLVHQQMQQVPTQQPQQQDLQPLPPPSALGAYSQREEHLQRQEALGEIHFAYVVNDGTPVNMKR